MSHRRHFFFLWLLLFFSSPQVETFSQGLYTARGYWEESTKANYVTIQKKLTKGDSLTANERLYLQDYESYLATYFKRLTEEEQQKYDNMKPQWDRELAAPAIPTAPSAGDKEFEWRGRGRLANGLYGFYYGLSIVAVGEINNAAAVGVPLITAGIWMLGPAINSKKYEGITRNTVRASNTGKLLGLAYGAALGLTVAGGSESAGKVVLGLSSVSSIALGEIGFQLQKKRNFSAAHIEMVRHYGFLGPWIGFAGMFSTGSSNANLVGASLLAGGISGIIIGNQLAKKYDYTSGDVAAISSLTFISTGLGFTAIAESLSNNSDMKSLILIPAASSIAGTIWCQRAVRGAHLTDKQGSTINLSAVGAALIGLGVVALADSNSAGVGIGVPCGLALITHQILLHNFKMKNLATNFQGSRHGKNNYHVSLKITPESYFLNKRIPAKDYSPLSISRIQQPLFSLVFRF